LDAERRWEEEESRKAILRAEAEDEAERIAAAKKKAAAERRERKRAVAVARQAEQEEAEREKVERKKQLKAAKRAAAEEHKRAEETQQKEEARARLAKFSVDYSRFDQLDDSDDDCNSDERDQESADVATTLEQTSRPGPTEGDDVVYDTEEFTPACSRSVAEFAAKALDSVTPEVRCAPASTGQEFSSPREVAVE
jgi:hypothetical protein